MQCGTPAQGKVHAMMSCPLIDFNPNIFEIPLGFIREGWSFDLRWYAVAYIAGLVVGWRYMISLARRPKLWTPAGSAVRKSPFGTEDIDDLLFWAAIGVIAGGRLGYVLFYQINAIWERRNKILSGDF